MKKCTIIITVSFLFLASCIDQASSTFTYRDLDYDSSKITIHPWDSSKFPKNIDPIPLKQEDLQIIDLLIKEAVDSFNEQQRQRINELKTIYKSVSDPELFMLNLDHFNIEYFPYNDVNHHKLVDIHGFCDESNKSKIYMEIWGRRKNYCHFQLTIDLKQKKSSEIMIDYDFG